MSYDLRDNFDAFLCYHKQYTSEAVALRCSVKKLLLTCNFIKKETVAQVLSCEFCEISKNTKNTLFNRTHQAAASVTLFPISKFKFFLFMPLMTCFTTGFDMVVLSTSIISSLTLGMNKSNSIGKIDICLHVPS